MLHSLFLYDQACRVEIKKIKSTKNGMGKVDKNAVTADSKAERSTIEIYGTWIIDFVIALYAVDSALLSFFSMYHD